VRDVAQPEGDADTVEMRGGKRQLLGVALDDRNEPAGIQKAVAAHRQHRAVDVRQHDLPGRTDPIGEQLREIAGAAGQVEHPHSRAHARRADREPLPKPVQTRRHQVVHQIVPGGDRVEHAAHASGLLVWRNLLEAEIRALAHRGRWSTFVLRTPVLVLGAAHRAHALSRLAPAAVIRSR